MMQIEEFQNEGGSHESGRLQNERMMEYLRLEKEREAAIRSGRPLEGPPAPQQPRVKMDFNASFSVQKDKVNNVLYHVLSIVQSSSEVLGVERDSWRFRIAPDPRFFMDEIKGMVFHTFYHENQRALQKLLVELRDAHHFVVPPNARIEAMNGNYLVMFSITTVPAPESRY